MFFFLPLLTKTSVNEIMIAYRITLAEILNSDLRDTISEEICANDDRNKLRGTQWFFG